MRIALKLLINNIKFKMFLFEIAFSKLFEFFNGLPPSGLKSSAAEKSLQETQQLLF